MSLLPELAELIGNPIHERSVAYRGKTSKVHFRELSVSEVETLFVDGVGGHTDGEIEGRGLRARMIAACVCGADGTQAMTVADAGALPGALAVKLEKICVEINALDDKGSADAKNGR